MKKIWLIIQGLLVAGSVCAYLTGAENVLGVLITIIIVESYPLNLLAGWLFFAYGDIANYPFVLILMAAVFAGIGYFQWFYLVPGIAKYLRGKFAKHDRNVEVLISPSEAKQIGEASEDWTVDWYSLKNHSPVEQVLSQDSK